ncbi:MAG: tRNA 4-thiouridine(8) synthase ThiI [Candidatus Marinimicrobia bacterium]|nr:tRNA 4-thiouridine(8) synthase ThiI [Candidatus Neomarinimicrobiota bacterium]MCF7828652.1 tRNA 4-thiouridine(8) synthase ThiI [Candidatus Neomarinimicrobiota bacterium]MCF7880393.1 tRNA 4-thiouridine(8) synthase ThiI [Candidatus Neomarinimicrobiota bacterium]
MKFEPNTIVIHYGEIALKGKNQPDFLNRLKSNLRHKLRQHDRDWKIVKAHSYMYIKVPKNQMVPTELLHSLEQVAGIAWLAPARFFSARSIKLLTDNPELEQVTDAVVTLASETFVLDADFAVRVTRGEKRFPMKSPEIGREFGASIIGETDWESVDLDNPDRAYYIDIYVEGIFVYTDKRQGIGGLPSGITGRVLTLLSGGIDSPAAAFLAAKRGCSVDFIHFTANQVQQNQAENYKVSKLARELSHYTLRSKLYLVPYTHFEFEIMGDSMEYELMLFRRFMIRVAEALANQNKIQALVTGDNLAQVASQTLENIVSNAQAVDLPILQPVLTYDKHEIVALAKEIGTYQLSLEPYKDCCSILSKHPKTITNHDQLSHLEQDIFSDYAGLIEQTLDDAVVLEYDCGKLVEE